jgi:DNA-binding FadR family transcriptional regulator
MKAEAPQLRPARWRRVRADQSPTRAEQAATLLADMTAAAEPGERLGTKDELRSACGVSAGTFNEALRIVQARELVTVRSGPGGGLFASRQSAMVRLGNSMLALDDDAASVEEAVRMRNALDPLLVEDALAHVSAHSVVGLRLALEHMQIAVDKGDDTAFVRANWALHARIAEISPNAMLRSIYLNLLEIIESRLLIVEPYADEPLREYVSARYELHAALVEAIAGRDPRALDLIHEHNTTGRVSAASSAPADESTFDHRPPLPKSAANSVSS